MTTAEAEMMTPPPLDLTPAEAEQVARLNVAQPDHCDECSPAALADYTRQLAQRDR